MFPYKIMKYRERSCIDGGRFERGKKKRLPEVHLCLKK
jgi:hypothetical protein